MNAAEARAKLDELKMAQLSPEEIRAADVMEQVANLKVLIEACVNRLEEDMIVPLCNMDSRYERRIMDEACAWLRDNEGFGMIRALVNSLTDEPRYLILSW